MMLREEGIPVSVIASLVGIAPSVFYAKYFSRPLDRRVSTGRPSHAPTAETRLQVSALKAAGCTLAHISSAIGVTIPTLYKHYRPELCAGSGTSTED